MRSLLLLALAAPLAACTVPDKFLIDGGDSPIDAAVDAAVDGADGPLDPVAPETTITHAPPLIDNATTVELAFESDQADAYFDCALDAEPWAACVSPARYMNLTAGSHTFRVRATGAGGADPTPASHTWTIDTSTPNTQIDGGPSGAVATTTASFTFSAPGVTGASYECRLDSGVYASCVSPQMYTALAEGTHAFHVRARNAAGVYDPSPATRTWAVDVTDPDTTITSGPPATTQLGLASFAFSSNETGITYECRVDGAAFAACTTPFKTWAGSGSHTLQVRARDGADNLDESPAIRTWTTTLANIVFVTSTTYRGDLGGIAGGDNRCAQRALAAGLQGQYRAWLSTPDVSAIDRLAGARGWIRLDGRPVVDRPEDLVAGKLFHPLRIDELGQATTEAIAIVMTGTGVNGRFYEANCANWTSAAASDELRGGDTYKTTRFWTAQWNSDCDDHHRLYCFGVDHDTPVAPPPPTGRRVFVTAAKWRPGGGIASADAVCAQEATAAGLSGTFRAALATSSAGALSRLSSSGAPWFRVDGVPVMDTAEALFAQNVTWLNTPLNVTAAGAYVYEFGYRAESYWSGPRLAGSTATCADWTSAASTDNGQLGENADTAAAKVFGSTSSFTGACNVSRRLLCFQE